MTAQELDVLVAEKVMGCAVGRYEVGPGYAVFDCKCDEQPHAYRDSSGDPDGIALYSMTGDGMLAVIEKMRERGFGYAISPDEAAFGLDPMDFECAEVRDSLPRAVCIAALRAIGEEV